MATTIIMQPEAAGDIRLELGDNEQSVWHPSAPRHVARTCRPGNPGEGWKAWITHLAQRQKPHSIHDLVRGKSWPLVWNLPDETHHTASGPFIRRLARLGRKEKCSSQVWHERLEHWLSIAPASTPSAAYALECLSVAYRLPRLVTFVSSYTWWALLERVRKVAADAVEDDLVRDLLAGQLLGGEIPLALAYVLPEINACRDLQVSSFRVLSAGLVEFLDGEGMLGDAHLGLMRPLLACWTRCRAIGHAMGEACWQDDAEVQYRWLVTQALRLARPDGSQIFTWASSGAWCPDLFATALDLGGDRKDGRAAEATLPKRSRKIRLSRRDSASKLPHPATHSEWAEVAVLRPCWKRNAERLAIRYGGGAVQLELISGGDMVLAGKWDFHITSAGKPMRIASPWEEICWVSDEEADYLELEADLEGGCTMQRQILLAREDRFLYAADVILGAPPDRLEYCARLPLGSAIRYQPDSESRDGYLVGDDRRGLVLPLALPEWRSDRRYGSLEAVDGSLELRQHTVGANLCCPLFMDLHPRRMTRQRTWRQLTIAESLAVQPRSVAVGYRVQCGRKQWLIYRSLAARASRSVLGQNLSSEFLAARFLRDGTMEELVEIEGYEAE